MKPLTTTYVSIDKESLDEGSKLDFDVYSANPSKTHMSLHLQSGSVLNHEQRQNLEAIERLYIVKEALPKYKKFIKEHIKKAHDGAVNDVEARTVDIYVNATKAVNDIFSNPESLKNVKAIHHVVDDLVDTVLQDDMAIETLLKLIAHDYYTHTHSINVSIYALSFGAFLKMDDAKLKDLGVSALMHDLGKSKIALEIINKPGKLTDEEFTELKKHPLVGYLLAKRLGVSSPDVLSGIKHHHEKVDGTGYPDRIKGEELSLFAKIIGICDIFDALSTKRSYKDPLSTFETLYLMKQHMSHHLDMKLLDEFIKMFKRQEKDSSLP